MQWRLFLAAWGLAAFQAVAADVTGAVSYSGPARKVSPVAVTRDLKVCGSSQPDESWRVGRKGEVGNAVVYIKGPVSGDASVPKDHLLDQKACRYIPHVVAARVGDRLVALNSDPVLHNVRGTRPDGRTPFNVALPITGMRKAFDLKEAGLIRAGCDAGHTWMNAYIHVFDHPYFTVTGDDGRFKLTGLAPGKYTLVLWHEFLGEQERSIDVPVQGLRLQLAFK